VAVLAIVERTCATQARSKNSLFRPFRSTDIFYRARGPEAEGDSRGDGDGDSDGDVEGMIQGQLLESLLVGSINC